MSSLATLTKTGRAAIAKAIAERQLHLAWGTGDEAWDEEGAETPSLVNATALVHEIGRRAVTVKGFVTPDDNGDIVIPVSATGTDVQEARYVSSSVPTPYLYVRVNYDFGDASNAVIREFGVFMDTITDESLPAGQRYFTPDQIKEPGLLMAAQIVLPSIQRSPSVRQTVEFVLPI